MRGRNAELHHVVRVRHKEHHHDARDRLPSADSLARRSPVQPCGRFRMHQQLPRGLVLCDITNRKPRRARAAPSHLKSPKGHARPSEGGGLSKRARPPPGLFDGVEASTDDLYEQKSDHFGGPRTRRELSLVFLGSRAARIYNDHFGFGVIVDRWNGSESLAQR